MVRNKPPHEGRLRAPQFAVAGERPETLNNAASAAAAELAELFASAPRTASPVGTTVVVRKRRQVSLPAASETSDPHAPGERHADAAPGEARRPRVFAMDAADTLSAPKAAGAGAGDAEAPDTQAASPAPPDSEPAVPLHRRAIRRTPHFRRPGSVTVIRPAATEPDVRPAEGASLDALERALAEASGTLEELAKDERPWDLDLGINQRWAQVDSALDKLKSTASRSSPLAARTRKGIVGG